MAEWWERPRDPRGFHVGGYGPVEHHPCCGRSSRAILGQRRRCIYEGRYGSGSRFFCFFHWQIEQGFITTIDGKQTIGPGEITREEPGDPDLFQLVREWRDQ